MRRNAAKPLRAEMRTPSTEEAFRRAQNTWETDGGRPAPEGMNSLFNPRVSRKKGDVMLGWSLSFFIIAVLAAIFGFTGIAAGASSVAKALFFLFLVLFVASLVIPRFHKPPPPHVP